MAAPAANHVGSLFDYVLVVERDSVVDSMPTIRDEDEDMLRDVALFCAPRGIDGVVSITTRSGTACWTFVLTNLTGSRRYGTCLAFTWPPKDRGSASSAPSAAAESTHSLCLLSRLPVADAARKLLGVLHTLLTQRLEPQHAALQPPPDSFTQTAASIVLEAPSAVGISVQFTFADELQQTPIAPICCRLAGPRELPAQDVSLLLLFQCLSIRHVLAVLACLCTERSVVFSSRSTSLPPRCWEAMLSLLWPLQWPLVYVPLLPDSLSMYLQAPTIFAYGVHTEALDEQLKDPDGLTGVVLVDLDYDTVTSTDATPRLPKKAADQLHRAVRVVLHPGVDDVDDPFSDAPGGRPERLSPAAQERKIRCAFAAFFAETLLHVDAHVAGVASLENPDEKNATDDEVAALTGQPPPGSYAEIRKSGFLQDWAESAGPAAHLDLPFMEDFIQTQMMMAFVDERILWAQQVREAARDGVAENVMLEFVDSPWEQLRRLAAAGNERQLGRSASLGGAKTEEELRAKVERGGSAAPCYEVAVELSMSQPTSPDQHPPKPLPSRLAALSEKLNIALLRSPAVPAPAAAAAGLSVETDDTATDLPAQGGEVVSKFYAAHVAEGEGDEPDLAGFYTPPATSKLGDAQEDLTEKLQLLLEGAAAQDLELEPEPEPEPEPELELEPKPEPEPEPEGQSVLSSLGSILRFQPASISFETAVAPPEFNAPAGWSTPEYRHARVARLVNGLTATLCTRPNAANLYLCRAVANETCEEPLAALQDYVRAWCLDRFLREGVDGGEPVIQRLCNQVGRLDSKMGSEAAILGYAVRGLYAVTATADALIGQAGERQLGELLHRCVANARSRVPEAPAQTAAEAEAVAEEESRLTPPFDSILMRGSVSLDGSLDGLEKMVRVRCLSALYIHAGD